MFNNIRTISELKGKLQAQESQIHALEKMCKVYVEAATRYKQLNEYSTYDLSTPEGLIKFKEYLLKKQKDIEVLEATINTKLTLKDKEIENIKNIVKERDERIELLKSLVKKG